MPTERVHDRHPIPCVAAGGVDAKLDSVHVELGELLREVARLDNKPSKPREADYFVRRIASGEPRLLKQAITNLVNFLVKQTEPVRLNQFEHPLLDYRLRLRPDAEAILKRLKGYVFDEVIAQPRIRTLEYKGQQIIAELFEAFRDNPGDLLPRSISARITPGSRHSLHRVVCDYIASMSDGEATAVYQRLFLAGNGSIFEPW
jgi:dGTPase